MSYAVSLTVIGKPANVSRCMVLMYALKPLEMARTSAMPMMPMLPANEVKKVLPFFVTRLLPLKDSAVRKDIEVFLRLFLTSFFRCFFSSSLMGASLRSGSPS